MLFFFFLMVRLPPRPTRTDTLFPYTTLFRSEGESVRGNAAEVGSVMPPDSRFCTGWKVREARLAARPLPRRQSPLFRPINSRGTHCHHGTPDRSARHRRIAGDFRAFFI